MKRILIAVIPLALLGACQTVPAAAPQSASSTVVTEPEAAAPVETAATEAVAPAMPVEKKPTFIKVEKSPLVASLVADSVKNDDVALMGLVSGARGYCGLDWQPGFVSFINMANQQKLNLSRVADDHGYYMGAAKRALEAAEYTCADQDLIDLRAIDPY